MFLKRLLFLWICLPIALCQTRTEPSEDSLTVDVEDHPCAELARILAPRTVGTGQQQKYGDYCKDLGEHTIGSFVVLVPDPVKTHLALYFDRSIETIERAMENTGYQRDAFWFPWRTEPSSEPAHPQRLQQMVTERRRREKLPGMLLFRREPAVPETAPDHIIVWLVGESPTTGIDQVAFVQLYDLLKTIGRQKMNIVGPTYSGSFRSLRRAIEHWRAYSEGAEPSSIISGTATNESAIREFIKIYPRFRTLRHTDNEALSLFIEYAQSAWKNDEPVGLLTELDTSFGSQFKSGAGLIASGKGPQNVVVLKFPRDISRLRTAYSEDVDLRGGEDTALGTPRQSLPVILGDPTVFNRNLPRFSEQSALAQESVLFQLGSTIRREKIRFLGILASDAMDTIFMARFLRRITPDVRLFVLDSDALYVEATEIAPVEGILVISTYPVFPRNRVWASMPSNSLPPILGSAFEVGLYNAIISTVWNSVHSSSSMPLADWKDPFRGAIGPPLWLMSVGYSGLRPLALLTTNPPEFSRTSRSTGMRGKWPEAEPPVRAWEILFLAVTVTIVSFILWYVVRQRKYTRQTTRRHLVVYPWAEGRLFSLFLAAMTLQSIYSVICFPLWSLYFSGSLSGNRITVYVTVSIALTIALLYMWANTFQPRIMALRGTSGRGTPDRRQPSITRGRALTTYCCALVCAACYLVFFWGWYSSSGEQRFFFAYRTHDIGSGVSPSVPFIFLGIGFVHFTFATYQRWRTWGERWPRLPWPDDDLILGLSSRQADGLGPEHHGLIGRPRRGDTFSRRDVSVRSLMPFRLVGSRQSVLSQFWSTGPFKQRFGLIVAGVRSRFRFLEPNWVVFANSAIAFAITMAVMKLIPHPQTFETPQFDWLFAFLLACLNGLIFMSWTQILQFWISLRVLLERLERHPLRHAFNRLPAQFSGSPIWQGGGTRSKLVTRSRSMETLALVISKMSGPSARLVDRDTVDWLSDQYRRLRILLRHRTQQRRTVIKMAFVAERLMDALRPYWQRGSSESLDAKSHRAPDCVVVAEEFIALRYFAYIRYVTLQLRSLLTFTSSAFVLAVVSINSYPFHSTTRIGWMMTGFFMILGSGIVWMFFRMDRDAVLNRITDNAANRLQQTFFAKVAYYGAIPAIVLFMSLFPRFGYYMNAWIQPLLKLVK